jgi:hypothetical protein
MGVLAVTAGTAYERTINPDRYFFKRADTVTKEHFPYIARLQGVDVKDLTDPQISATTYLIKVLDIDTPTKDQLTATEYLKTNGGGFGGLHTQIIDPTLAQIMATAYLIRKLKNTHPTLAQITATDYLLEKLKNELDAQQVSSKIDRLLNATAYLIGQLHIDQPTDDEMHATFWLMRYEKVLNPTAQDIFDWSYLLDCVQFSLTLDFIPALRYLSSLGLPKPTEYELQAAVLLMTKNYLSSPTLEQIRNLASIPFVCHNMRTTLAAHMKANPNSIPLIAMVIGAGPKQGSRTYYRCFEFYGRVSDTTDNSLQNRLFTKPARFVSVSNFDKLCDENLPPTFVKVTQANQESCGLPHPLYNHRLGDWVVFDQLIADPQDETAVRFVNPVGYTSSDFLDDGQLRSVKFHRNG